MSLATKGGIKNTTIFCLRSILILRFQIHFWIYINHSIFIYAKNDTSDVSYLWKFSWDFLKLSSVSSLSAAHATLHRIQKWQWVEKYVLSSIATHTINLDRSGLVLENSTCNRETLKKIGPNLSYLYEMLLARKSLTFQQT